MNKTILIIGIMSILLIGLVSANIDNYNTEYLFEQNLNDNIGSNDLSGSIPYLSDSVLSTYSVDFRGHSNTTGVINSSIINYGNDFTITGWIKTNETTGNQGILGYSLDVNNFGTFQITSNCLKLVHQDFNPSYQNSIDQMCGLTNETLSDWTFFALRIGQSSATTNLYVGGVTYTTGSSPNYNRLGTDNFWIGGASGLNFNGQIDDIRIYQESLNDYDLYLIQNGLTYCSDNNVSTQCECNSDLTNWEDDGTGKDFCYILQNEELTLETNTYDLTYLNSHRIILEENASLNGNNSDISTSSYLPIYMKDNTTLENINMIGQYLEANQFGFPTYMIYGSSTFKDQTLKNIDVYDARFGLAFFGGGMTIENVDLNRAGWRTYGGNTNIENASCVGTPNLKINSPFGVEFGFYGGYSQYQNNLNINNFYVDCYTYYGEAMELYPTGDDMSNVNINNLTFNNTANNYGIHIYGDVYSDSFMRDVTITNSNFVTGGLTNNGINTNLDGNNTYHDNFFITNLNQGTGGDYNITFNTQESEVTFPNITSGTTQVNDVVISETSVYAEDSFNKPASISFNVNNIYYVPFRDGILCSPTYCSNIVNNGTKLTFDVSGFSNYTYGIDELGNFQAYHNQTSDVITLNQTGVDIYVNWTQSFSPSNLSIDYTIYLERLLSENYSSPTSSLNDTINVNSNNIVNGVYDLYVEASDGDDTKISYASPQLTFCINEWVTTSGVCINNVRNVTYVDNNNCPIEYDKPSSYLENCVIDSTSENGYIWVWLIILAILILMIISKVGIGWLMLAIFIILFAIFGVSEFTDDNNIQIIIVILGILVLGVAISQMFGDDSRQ